MRKLARDIYRRPTFQEEGLASDKALRKRPSLGHGGKAPGWLEKPERRGEQKERGEEARAGHRA